MRRREGVEFRLRKIREKRRKGKGKEEFERGEKKRKREWGLRKVWKGK